MVDIYTNKVLDFRSLDQKVDTKADKNVSTSNTDGLMSSSDKIKLDGIEEGANKYIHPSDINTLHVTSNEKAIWNSKASTDVVTTSTNGLMSSGDKSKLDGIAVNANKTVLNNTVTSTSTSEGATANAVKIAYDKGIEALNKANQAFQSASDGKNKIATAITGKGVSASGSDSYQTLSDKIGQISTGGLDIVVTTKLPSTVTHGRIVLIESSYNEIKIDNPAVALNENDIYIDASTYPSSGNSTKYVVLRDGKNLLGLYLTGAYIRKGGNNKSIDAYYGVGSNWIQFSYSQYVIFENGSSPIGISNIQTWKDCGNGYYTDTRMNLVSNNLRMTSSQSSWGPYWGTMKNSNAINLSGFKTLRYELATSTSAPYADRGYSFNLGANTDYNASNSSVKVSRSIQDIKAGNYIFDINISSLNGNGYLFVGFDGDADNTYFNLDIKKISLF